MSWAFDPPDGLDEQLNDSEGYVTLGPAMTWSTPNIRCFNVATHSRLEVELHRRLEADRGL